MNKKITTTIMTAVYTIMILMMLAPQALAANYNVNLELDTNYIKMGPCSGGTMVKGTLQNTGDITDTYTMTPENNWIMITPQKVALTPGESKSIALFITPPCDIEPKEYELDITASSDNSEDTETITIDVLKVHSVEIDTVSTKTSCIGEKETFTLSISNMGKTEETFRITTTSGLLEKEEITLNSGESKEIDLKIPVTTDKKTVDVTVKSTTSYAEDSKSVNILGIQCYSHDIAITPESKTMCIKDSSDFTLTIRNTGTKEDTYKITTDFGELSAVTATIDAGQEEKIKLTVNPQDMSEYKANIEVTSAYETKKITVTTRAENCKGVAVITIPKEKTVCKGDTAQYSITVKNTGKTEDTLDMSATMGELSEKTITIEAGDTKEVTLNIPTEELTDNTYEVTVTAESDVKDTSKSILIIEDCYSSALTIYPEVIKVCPGTNAVFTATLENTGKNTDTYTLETSIGQLEENTIVLDSQNTRDITITVPTETESEDVTINMFSKNTQNTETVKITLKDEETCYGFTVSASPEIIEASEYKGYLYTLTVKNTGEYASEFSVSAVSGPDWIFIDPETLNIEKDSQERFYIYVSPPYGTESGTYSIDIETKRDSTTTKTTTVKLMLGEDGKETIPIENTEDPKEEEPKEVPKTYPVNVDTETIYEIQENYTEKIIGTYTKDDKDTEFIINFRTGSFIIEIGDARIEDEEPELGENIYELTTEDKQYIVTIEFTEVNTTTDTYRFKVKEAQVTELDKTDSTSPTGNATEERAPISKNLIYATIIGLLIIILILFGPEIAEKTKDFFTEEVDDEKKEEEEKAEPEMIAQTTEGIPLEEISGIGGKKAEALRKAGIMDVGDLANANISDVMAETVTSEKQAKSLIKKAKALVKKESKKEEKEKSEKEKPKKKATRKDVKEDIKDILESI